MTIPIRQGFTAFTIGSSLHSWASFRDLILAAKVTHLVDVRSSPRSRLAHFNQAKLQSNLARDDIAYEYLGEQLGGRSESGVADYEAMAETPSFNEGIERVMQLVLDDHVPVIMCAEAEPLQCHRFLLVGRELVLRAINVVHLLKDGGYETHMTTEARLLQAHGLNGSPGWWSERVHRAYRLQNERLQGPLPHTGSRPPNAR